MSQRCSLCGRGPRIGVSRSHSMRATKRWKNLNLQLKKVGGKRARVCGKCAKKLSGR